MSIRKLRISQQAKALGAEDELDGLDDAGNDLLFDVPESTPRWKQIADENRIRTMFHDPEQGQPYWVAMFSPSRIENDEVERGETEREAVIALIHRLQLDGWREVSL